MSNIYHALARNQFLQPVADAVNSYIEKKRQEKTFGELIDRINSLSKTQTVNETSNQPIDFQSQVGRGNANYNVFTGTDTPGEFDNSAPIVPEKPNLMKQATTIPQAGQPTPMQQITQQREVNLSPQEYNKNLMLELVKAAQQGGIKPEAINALSGIFGKEIPKRITVKNNEDVGHFEGNKFVKDYSNEEPIKPEKPTEQPDVTIDFKILKDEKGKPKVYKIVSNKKTGETLSKTPQGEPDKVEGVTVNNYSGERLQFDKEKDNRTQKEKDVAGQGAYDAIMGTWDDEEKAYVLNKGTKDEKKFKTDEQVQKYAEDYVNMNGYLNVNKWKRQKGGQKTETKKSNYEEGKVYIDANRNKAKYVNGKFVEVK